MKKIGITTTVPVEVLLAAGYRPVDLNNVLVGADDPGHFINIAERDGFPLNCCSWIKGIYGVCLESDIEDIICVTGGDCSNTQMLREVLNLRGFNTIPFSYPDRPDPAPMQRELERLAAILGTTLDAAGKVREGLQPCRELAIKLDEATWRENTASGRENHLWLVSASDFNGSPERYCNELQELVDLLMERRPYPSDEIRLGYIGVPPVYAREFYPFIERQNARVVFNEIQRQFAMPDSGDSLAEQYTRYTYPYSVTGRLADIKREIEVRQIQGVIHYVQAFCHRSIADIVFREAIDLPVLTLEGNDSFFLNSHARTRIEAFIDMIERSRKQKTGTASSSVKNQSGGA